MRYLSCLLLLCISLNGLSQPNPLYGLWEDSGSQVYYLVTVDRANGTKTNIAQIQGLTGYITPQTAFVNNQCNQYGFRGQASANAEMNVLDATTGSNISSVLFDQIAVGFEYHCGNDTVYAIWEEPVTTIYHLVAIDVATGNVHKIGFIPGTTGYVGGSFSLDTRTDQYNFIGLSGANNKFFSIDIHTGAIINDNIISDNIAGHRYDCVNEQIVGLWEDINRQIYYLVSIDPVSATFDTIGRLSGVDPGYVSGTHSYDPSTQQYTYMGFMGPNTHLISIDVNTANIVSSPAFSFNVNGMATNMCCLAPAPPVAGFKADTTLITMGETVSFTDQSLFCPDTWGWTFEGGNPFNSTNEHPANILYNSPGEYDVRLTVSNTTGTDSITKTTHITVLGLAPVSDFTADQLQIDAGGTVNFTDLSINDPDTWSWTFEGGTPGVSADEDPMNIQFPDPGCFEVTLVASNAWGQDSVTKTCYITVDSLPSGVGILAPGLEISIVPNPIRQQAVLDLSKHHLPLTFTLYSLSGQQVFSKTVDRPQFVLDKGSLPKGVYLYRISEHGRDIHSGKLVIE